LAFPKYIRSCTREKDALIWRERIKCLNHFRIYYKKFKLWEILVKRIKELGWYILVVIILIIIFKVQPLKNHTKPIELTFAELNGNSLYNLTHGEFLKDEFTGEYYADECIEETNSSFIKSICYYDFNYELTVNINRRRYVYCEVDKEVWDEIKTTKSIGSYYNAHIKNQYFCDY